MTKTGQVLSDSQADALLHFLTHAQTFHEFSALKIPGRVASSGPPFVPLPSAPSSPSLPILNTLFRKLALSLPGFKDADPSLWNRHVQGVLEDMAAHELSDSFDKGTISKRKTVGYGIVVVAECASRGVFAGCPKAAQRKAEYNPGKVEDVREAWDSLADGFIYGEDMDDLVDWAAKTDKLAELPSRYQAAHRFAAITFASFLHYLLALNPAGPTLRHLLQRVHSMLPYTLVRQALRVGNAAAMINAVVKLFLYRAPTLRGLFRSGGERNANLLQSIMSSVFTADKNALTKRLTALNSSSHAGTPAQHTALEAYVQATSREDKQALRDFACARPTSLIAAIMEKDDVEAPKDDKTNECLQERLFLLLSIRDREALAEVLCQRPRVQPSPNPASAPSPNPSPKPSPKSSPKLMPWSSPKPSALTLPASEDPAAVPDDPNADDNLTAGIRMALAAFEPILRAVQRGADLPRAAGDAQVFLDALLALPPRAGVREYVKLVDEHQGNLHNFLHLCAKEPEVRKWYTEWYRKCLVSYKAENPRPRGGAGGMRTVLEQLVQGLSETERSEVMSEVDAYAVHLQKLKDHSDRRMQALFNASSPPTSSPSPPASDDDDSEDEFHDANDTPHPRADPFSSLSLSSDIDDGGAAGPGLWIASWQGMVDRTAVTPASVSGPVRYGADGGVQAASAGDPNESTVSLQSTASTSSGRSGRSGVFRKKKEKKEEEVQGTGGKTAGERVGLVGNAMPVMSVTGRLLRAGFEKILVEGHMQ